MARPQLLPIFSLILFLFLYSKCDAKLECPGLLIKSTCVHNQTYEWNRKDIGHNLKAWINSVDILFSLTESDRIHSDARQKVIKDPKTGVLMYISNIDCVSKQSIGPVWQIGGEIGEIGSHQFHDGFFYAISNEQGSLAGKCFTIPSGF